MRSIPRTALMRLVKRTINSEGALTSRRLVSVLAEREELYVVFQGEKEAVSAKAMERQLSKSTQFIKNEDDEWEIHDFWGKKETAEPKTSSEPST